MPWLLNEDAAIKAKLQGLKVTDVNAPTAGRPVGVRFRLPETELADLTFPNVIVEHAGLYLDNEREHRGTNIRLPYAPEGYDLWATPEDPGTSPYLADFPLPYNVDYLVSVYSRKIQHQMVLRSALAAFDRIPDRFGFLEIPQDGTIRRLDRMGGPDLQAYHDNDNKRVFRDAYRLRVSSELLQSQVHTVSKVLSTVINIHDKDSQTLLETLTDVYN